MYQRSARAMRSHFGVRPDKHDGSDRRRERRSRRRPHSALLRGLMAAALLAPGMGGSGSPQPTGPETVISGPTMGTSYTVKLASLPAEATGAEFEAQIDTLLEQINAQMSTYRPDSEISRFNRHEGTDWFDVSEETAEVVAQAVRLSEISDGAFDVTVGPLVNLWSFGPMPDRAGVPSDSEVEAAGRNVGYRQLHVRRSPPALRKDNAGVSVDLSAIAKGFAVDRVAELLQSSGVRDYWVEIGGEIRTAGRKADGNGWRVGIEFPLDQRRSVTPRHILELMDRAVATSGDYRNFFEANGRRYSHTIDPRTGAPVEHALASATVVAANCMFADGAATALMVLGPDRGYDWAVSQGLAALFIVRDNGGFVDKATPEFQELINLPRGGSPIVLVVAAIVLFALAIVAMAVGVLIGNRRLRGTCGGLAGWKDEQGEPLCYACTSPSESCEGLRANPSAESASQPKANPRDAVDSGESGSMAQ